jgi:hypothetical protein
MASRRDYEREAENLWEEKIRVQKKAFIERYIIVAKNVEADAECDAFIEKNKVKFKQAVNKLQKLMDALRPGEGRYITFTELFGGELSSDEIFYFTQKLKRTCFSGGQVIILNDDAKRIYYHQFGPDD